MILIHIYFAIHCIDGKGGDLEIARKEIGLEWMLRPEARVNKPPAIAIENKPKETLTEEVCPEFIE